MFNIISFLFRILYHHFCLIRGYLTIDDKQSGDFAESPNYSFHRYPNTLSLLIKDFIGQL